MRLAVSAGIAPRRLTGWEPCGEPEWDWVDVAIIRAWGDLQEQLCMCGRPRSMHVDDKPSDYHPAFFTCTATKALSDWQTLMAKADASLPPAALADARADKRARDQGFDPDRPRQWFTWTDDEGAPTP